MTSHQCAGLFLYSCAVTVLLVAVLAPVSVNSAAVKMSSVQHPAFANAGKKEGLQIWRVENFEPVPYPEKDYGKFYSGDSYIVLKTVADGKKKDSFHWDIHFWLGSKTSQDESGAAAILSVELDDGLGGGPVQHREVEGHESQQFLSYFKSGVRYLPGGVASGFNHVNTNDPGEKKLYQVKGKKNVRVRQVEVNVKSMNKGDCFILDSGSEIYVYVGPNAKGTEKVKATAAANMIRDQDHSGRAHVTIVDSSSTETEVQKFFTELGSGSPSQVPDETKGGDDQEFESKQDATVTLYKVSDAGGKLVSEKISQKPLSQNMLVTDDCFILDTVTSGIYVWIGKKGTVQEKVEALKKAQLFLTEKNYPTWTKVVRVVEGAEPAAFREYFNSWQQRSPSPSRKSPGKN
ncbi:actin depolymerizing venom protein gelsolin 1-like [Lycorma delicatula]|uniref:actin depolymerizing venom protein gelsolin 1-like n=1 Tax=Lycorma delicatula TaxID=130591 RepID=UPI003F51362C